MCKDTADGHSKKEMVSFFYLAHAPWFLPVFVMF